MAPKSTYKVTIDIDMKNVGDLMKVEAELENIIKLSKRVEQNAGKGFDKLARSTKKTQIEMRKAGRGLQNVSYQLQDIITQVSGGVDPFISLGQQLPQMLINMGALGAVVGVVAATLPLMIKALSSTSDEAKTLQDSIENLTEAGDQYSDSLKRYAEDQSTFNAAVLATSETLLNSELSKFIEMASGELQTTGIDILIRRLETMKSLVNEISGPLKTLSQLAEAGGRGLMAFASTNILTDSTLKLINYFIELNDEAEAAGISLQKLQDQFNVDIFTAIKLKPLIEGFDTANASIEDQKQLLADLMEIYENAPLGEKTGLLALIREIEKTFGSMEVAAEKATTGVLKFIEVSAQRVATGQTVAAVRENDFQQQQEEYLDMQFKLTQAAELREEKEREAAEAAADRLKFSTQAAKTFEKSFNTAFDGVAMGTQNVSDAFRNMAKVIIAQLLKIAAYKTIAGFGFGGEFGGQVAWGAAQGGVVSGGNKVQAFASGGIVNGPTAFGMSRGRTGLMGEAGPEMIAPVKRMPNGDMGVGASPVNVTVNNNAAGVETVARQDSNGGLTIDVVLKQAAQAIQSGGNVFADSLEKSYSLNRGRSTY